MRIISPLIFLLVLKLNAFSMSPSFPVDSAINSPLKLQIGLGTVNYLGDLSFVSKIPSPKVFVTNIRHSASLSLSKKFKFGPDFHATYFYARLYGDDYTWAQKNFDVYWQRFVRNLHFRNDIHVISWRVSQEIFPRKRTGLSLGSGFSWILSNPKASKRINDDSTEWFELRPLHTSGQNYNYSKWLMGIPLFGDFKFRVNKKLEIGLTLNYRFVLSDWIDDVGFASYPNFKSLEEQYGQESVFFSYRSKEVINSPSGSTRIPVLAKIYEEYSYGRYKDSISISELIDKIGYNPYEDSILRGHPKNDRFYTLQFKFKYSF
ncbi:hypothetical protein [Jiulongibacter sediminis]|uniref:Outer membrane protein beta-barrel domain-containing protein n=1 Tax=Jiulongibacter sediminis TaxID=1605367 RepID=A0A0N8H9E2_9BACT|nr:hypothetical protein [Jiulongibacter sediminis]KPM47124.1 hypothetical protein AFM12_14980 [Jiulongibacter sediminis]TBX22685.1 hypothetical protein TK44_14990 [Jiulongibacter sediminis]